MNWSLRSSCETGQRPHGALSDVAVSQYMIYTTCIPFSFCPASALRPSTSYTCCRSAESNTTVDRTIDLLHDTYSG